MTKTGEEKQAYRCCIKENTPIEEQLEKDNIKKDN
jgi:hypothetical protein